MNESDGLVTVLKMISVTAQVHSSCPGRPDARCAEINVSIVSHSADLEDRLCAFRSGGDGSALF